jgi:hypothetical protein
MAYAYGFTTVFGGRTMMYNEEVRVWLGQRILDDHPAKQTP